MPQTPYTTNHQPTCPDGTSGLSEQDAEERLRTDGPNAIEHRAGAGLGAIAWAVLTQPMILLLLATAGVYAVLGSLGDAALLLTSVAAVAALSIYQSRRTQGILQALKALSSPRCTVIRSGQARRISSEYLVRGDLLVIDEGDRLAADATLVEGNELHADESLLTGESEPIVKRPASHEATGSLKPENQLRAGSLIVQGDGAAIVTHTGERTAVGRIGRSITDLTARPSRLQEELKQIIQRVAVLATLTCVLATALYAARDGSWAKGMLVGLTLALSLIPEEFAVVWTVMLALGASRLARQRVLTRQPQAIEALGTVTVLCVDKTGTLTSNHMTVVDTCDGSAQGATAAPDSGLARRVLRCAALASIPHGIEPMDQAIFEALGDRGMPTGSLNPGPRSGVKPGKPYVSHWWTGPKDAEHVVHVKGAYESVLALCTMDCASTKARLMAQAKRWCDDGLRVLAVAEGRFATMPSDGGLPEGIELHAVGLLALADPLRGEVPQAVLQCQAAGMRVVMITGDSPLTASRIAREAGLAGETPGVMTGDQLSQANDPQLRQLVGSITVFARVSPDQKLRIVRALQDQGHVVAMTGDGINDAPALKAADVGVAMGQRGTDVAREAAALVLLDDNFASLVTAVRAGRRIFENLQRSLGYLFAVHVPIAGAAMLPILTDGPTLLQPLHVVLLEMVIDPACSLVFEAEPADDDLMRRPPRPATAKLWSWGAAARAVSVGGVAFAGVALTYWFCRDTGMSNKQLQFVNFGAILVTNILMLAWFLRHHGQSRGTNRAFHALVLLLCVLATAAVSTPVTRDWVGMPAWLAGPLAAVALTAGSWSAWKFLKGMSSA